MSFNKSLNLSSYIQDIITDEEYEIAQQEDFEYEYKDQDYQSDYSFNTEDYKDNYLLLHQSKKDSTNDTKQKSDMGTNKPISLQWGRVKRRDNR